MKRAICLSWVGVTLVLAGCGGGSDRPSEAEQLRAVAHTLDQPMDRLHEAVADARTSDRSSMITLRAAADRGEAALRSAQQDLQLIATPAQVGVRSPARQMSDALQDLRALTDALSPRWISITDLELAAERAGQTTQDSSMTLPRIDADRLIASLRRSRRSNAPARTRGGLSMAVGSDNATEGATAVAASYEDYTGPAFQAKLPTGSGWAAPAQSQPTPGRLFRTSVRGPGGMFVIIDYTPYEAATFGGTYRSRTQVGHTAFGSAIKYVFQGGRLPECQRSTCVDYIINDPAGSGGFGVLAGGSSPTAAGQIARTVAESVVPLGE